MSWIRRSFSMLPQPSAALSDPEERVRASVLSGLLFVCVPPAFVTLVVQLMVVDDFQRTFMSNSVGLLVLFALALGSRSKWYRACAVGALFSIVGISAMAGLGNPDDPVWWAYEVISTLLATLFVSARMASAVALFAIFTTGAVLFHNGFEPARDLAPLMFHIVFGPLLVLLAVFRDLLEERRLHELDRNRGLLEQAEEIANVGHWEWSGEAFELSRGLQRMLRLPARVSLEKFVDPFDEQSRLQLQQLVRGEVWQERLDLVFTGEDGQERYAMMSVEQDAVLVGTVQDLTERRLAEQDHAELQRQVMEAQRLELVGRIAGGIAHDFNNLLTVVQATSEFLRECEPDERGTYLDELEASLGRGAGLTRQLLAYARKQVLQPRDLEIARVIEQMLPILDRLVGRAVLSVHIDPEAQDARVHVDGSQMEQVLLNLVLNAREALPDEGGEISVLLSIADGCVILEVADNGKGLEPDVGERIFEPFFTSGKESGTGLGLSTVYGIVHQSSGEITFDSAPGEGTTFRVSLPLGEPSRQGELDSEPSPRRRTTLTGGKIRVLVVDDEPMVLRYVSRSLTKKGFDVVTAGGVVAARECWAEDAGGFDMLVTDVMMPDGSGIEMASEFIEGHEVPVILMSGYSEDLVGSGGAARFSGFVRKPFTIDELMAVVDTIRRSQNM